MLKDVEIMICLSEWVKSFE